MGCWGHRDFKKEKRMEAGPLFMLCAEDYAKSKEGVVFLTST